MSRIVLCVVMLSMLMFGCGKPKIDTSSPEKSKASMEKVKASLDESEREAFESAVMVVGMSSLGDSLGEILGNSEVVEEKMKAALDGKTGREVIEEAEAIRTRREESARREAEEEKERQQVQAKEEIRELQGKIESAKAAKDALKAFEVKTSRFYKRQQRFGSPEPIIELTVHNGTDHAISRAYLVLLAYFTFGLHR